MKIIVRGVLLILLQYSTTILSLNMITTAYSKNCPRDGCIQAQLHMVIMIIKSLYLFLIGAWVELALMPEE